MKLAIHEVETTAETAHVFGGARYQYNRQAKVTAKGYDNGMEVTVIIKMPYDYHRIPKLETPLNVSISFDQEIKTTKTIKLV